jgi:uracil-DNA glycosylase
MKTDWQHVIGTEKGEDYFRNLQQFIAREYNQKKIYPPKDLIYQALVLTSFKATKVVILGQDPYIQQGQAHGLSFSVADPNAKFPPSLENIFIELENDLGVKRTKSDLTDWAEQGVLLLNTVLTVVAGKSASHRGKGWEQFTNQIIAGLNNRTEPVVFVLWGNDARQKKVLITNPQHKIIESSHPSPYSAQYGFFGSKPFSRINQYLLENGQEVIRWG